MILYVAFCDYIFLFSILPSKFIQLVVILLFYSFLQPNNILVYGHITFDFFIHDLMKLWFIFPFKN